MKRKRKGPGDAAGTYEPCLSTLANRGDGHVIFSSREIPRSICDVLFVKKSVALDSPRVIDHWVESWSEILDYREREEQEYLSRLSTLNDTPVGRLRMSLDGMYLTNMTENRRAFGTPETPGYLLESLREMEAFMCREGAIDRKVPVETLIDHGAVLRFFAQHR